MRVLIIVMAVIAVMLAVVAAGQKASAAVWIDPSPTVYAPTVIRTVQPTTVYTYPAPVVTYPTTTTTFVPAVVVPQHGVIRQHVGPFGRVRTTYWGW